MQASDGEKHWLWDNWVLLAMAAMISFSICNIFIGEISDLGMSSISYFCSGSLIFSIVYFIYQKEWSKRNNEQRGILDAQGRDKKVLLRTWDNKFDWYTLFVIFSGAVF